ncbi:hypothetical protein DSO57_1004287 [Entomophthora muscae]|uniref:Uncharacterized protein n=1 Tax=Entomophthora muscae TaxID=34485 RepID=A0ACC2TWS8_9FUNG|nr:hypothetical protein DSO57_1004287 [Entomophthora muscae]
MKGMVDIMVPNSGPWSLLRQSLSPILWWALATVLAYSIPSQPMPLPMYGFLTWGSIPGNISQYTGVTQDVSSSIEHFAAKAE